MALINCMHGLHGSAHVIIMSIQVVGHKTKQGRLVANGVAFLPILILNIWGWLTNKSGCLLYLHKRLKAKGGGLPQPL